MGYKNLYKIEKFELSDEVKNRLEKEELFFAVVPEENCILTYDVLDVKECAESDDEMDEDFESEKVSFDNNVMMIWISSYTLDDGEKKAVISEFFANEK